MIQTTVHRHAVENLASDVSAESKKLPAMLLNLTAVVKGDGFYKFTG